MAAPDLKGDAHPRVAPEPQVDRGTTIGGYEVIRLLGRGGWAASTWLAIPGSVATWPSR